MSENVLGGLIGILSVLPGLILGLAILIGKWKPASIAGARDPHRARIATGVYTLFVVGMVMALSLCLVLLPEARVQPLVPYAAGSIVLASFVGLIPLLRATRT